MAEYDKSVLRGLRKSDIADLKDAIGKSDASYIRGMIQWYRRNPVRGNDLLVPFLQDCLRHCSSSGQSSSQSE